MSLTSVTAADFARPVDVEVVPLGETAWAIGLSGAPEAQLQPCLLACQRALAAEASMGVSPRWVSVVPGLTTVTVFADPLATQAGGIELWRQTGERLRALSQAAVAALLQAPLPIEDVAPVSVPEAGLAHRLWQLPICVEAPHAEDLQAVALDRSTSPAMVLEALLSRVFQVRMLGFLPGFAYMDGWPRELSVPRRATPRTRVPAGSVAVAETFCAIYPWDSPGGWHLLGHMPLPLFDPAHPEGASWLRPGDRLRFRRVGLDEWAQLRQAVDKAEASGQPWDRSTFAVGGDEDPRPLEEG
jgi:KipI family sensor histidine kinase inhibitor